MVLTALVGLPPEPVKHQEGAMTACRRPGAKGGVLSASSEDAPSLACDTTIPMVRRQLHMLWSFAQREIATTHICKETGDGVSVSFQVQDDVRAAVP